MVRDFAAIGTQTWIDFADDQRLTAQMSRYQSQAGETGLISTAIYRGVREGQRIRRNRFNGFSGTAGRIAGGRPG